MGFELYTKEDPGWFDIDSIRISPAAQELLDADSFATMLQAHKDTLWTGCSAVGFMNEVSLMCGGPILSNPTVKNQEMYLLTEPDGDTYIMLAVPEDRTAYYLGETDGWGPPIFPVHKPLTDPFQAVRRACVWPHKALQARLLFIGPALGSVT